MLNWMKLIKNTDFFAYWNKCRLYRHKEDFRRFILEGYGDADILEVHSYGTEHTGSIVYRIEEFGCKVGFFCEVLYLLIWLYYAEDRGFIPFVDWGKNHLYYETNGINEEKNVFLYYFQPLNEVKQIDQMAHVINAKVENIHIIQNQLSTHGYDISQEYFEGLSNILKKYIRYNEFTQNYLENEYVKLLGDKKVLAVHFRGTDFRRQYNRHPVMVTIEEEIKCVYELMNKGQYEYIFLATDEENAIGKFVLEFGQTVKYYDDTWRAIDSDDSVAYSRSDRPNHHYLLGLEVMRDQYTLTRADGLVCGVSNLTHVARMMRRAWYEKDYDDLVIIDKGLCINMNPFDEAKH